jgi:hypothetical protein
MSQRKEITIPIVKAVVFNESKIVDEPIITVIPKTVSSHIDDEIPFTPTIPIGLTLSIVGLGYLLMKGKKK